MNQDHYDQIRKKAVQEFYNKVCREAEINMLKTNTLEGSHYSAMNKIIKDYK